MFTKRQILPLSEISHPVEMQLAKHSRGLQVIYLIILFTLLVGVILLFVIKTDVSVRSSGTIKALADKNTLKSPAEGIIDSVFIKENQLVKQGQELIKIRSVALEEKNKATQKQNTDVQSRIDDLRLLVAGKTNGLKSPLYLQQNNLYRQKLADASNRYALALKNFERFDYLFKQNAVSSLELDNAKFDKQSAASEMALIQKQQLSEWQAELNALTTQNQQLSAEIGINTESRSQYIIKASMSGTIQNINGLQPGNFVAGNEILGEISPDQALIAEVYVTPKDIGLIKPGNAVLIYVDAFNYNSWGSINGKIQSISDDVLTSDGRPFFKVRCTLNKTSLQLQNGYTGKLKKGMTMQARFKIARRTLFQLLYDQTNDWLNPNSVSNESTAAK